MGSMEWATGLARIRNYTFKIQTPIGAGTGFLLTVPNPVGLCSVATAYHVVAHAYQWEEPLRLTYSPTQQPLLLRAPDRFIFPNPRADLAVIAFSNRGFSLPEKDLTLAPADKHIKPGIQIGWAGYPAVAPGHLSFFTGTVSCFLDEELAYLVDGVAINGVSGGPAFSVISKVDVDVIGVVTAYIPNRASGESLPGVCFVSGISPLYHVVKTVKSVDEAREKAERIEAEQSASGDSSTNAEGIGTPEQ